MDTGTALLVALGLVAVATVLGLIWQRRRGRTVIVHDGTVVRPADVDTAEAFGSTATLLQFSTELCASCPATRRLLGTLASEHPGVRHVDIDLTHRSDLARRFDVLQTPTILILDRDGHVRARIGGAPRTDELRRELDHLMGADHVSI
jgi:thiol-disulfide isomerase/thioredoxin